MASLREYNMLFRLNAQLGGSYNGTFKTAQGSIVSLQKEIVALSKTQSNISAYQRQQSAIDANVKKLGVYEQQLDNIQREMNETGEFSSALANKMLSKQQQIEKTSTTIDRQREKLSQLGGALRDAGVDTDNLTKEHADLAVKIDEVKKSQEEAADAAAEFGSAGSQAITAVHEVLISSGIIKLLQKVAGEIQACSDASIGFEDDMTGVAKTTDFTTSELAEMGESIKEMSTVIPEIPKEIAAIEETAGQLGIAKGYMLDFTEIMAMLGTATNMTSTEAATLSAQFASITGMDPSFYDEYGSTIVYLGNSYATTERNIAEMSQTIASSGSIANMAEDQILGISSAVTSLGFSAQMGGTQMNKLIADINSAVISGEGLDDWASAAGTSAEDFAAAWKDDAAGALDMFIQGLNETYKSGGDVYSILRDLGITETRMVTIITSLAKSGDRLTDSLVAANEAWNENTALTEEADKRYSNTLSKLTMMTNAWHNLQIAVGDNYTPTLREVYDVGTDLFKQATEFVQLNPELVKGGTATVAVFGAATIGVAGYTAAVKVATAATTVFGTVSKVALGPVMLGIAGVAALTGVLVALGSTIDEEQAELAALTATSREQYEQMKELEDEYNEVCGTMDETKTEVVLLKKELDEATKAFEENKQTAEELAEAHREVIDAHNELMAAHEETMDNLDNEARSVDSLMSSLEGMVAEEEKTAAAKQEILAIVDLLNESVPELGLSYNEYAGSLNMTADAIRAVAEAEVAREQNATNYEELKKFTANETGLKDDLKARKEETEAAEDELTDAQNAYNKKLEEMGGWDGGTSSLRQKGLALKPYTDAVTTAKAAVEEATIAEGKAQTAWDENQAKVKELSEAVAGYTEETTEGSVGIQGAISDVKGQMDTLALAYDEAYEAARDSIGGQYSLWEEAAEVAAISADEINAALESQASYWGDYNTNLAGLRERSTEIEGLNEVLASFADGSEDSVNAVAGMATASDEDLAAMVANWQALQEEQDSVAGSLAGIETDFTATMDALQLQLETSIAEMDLSEEAIQAGRDTVLGYKEGIDEMLPEVAAAFERIGDAGLDSFDARMDRNSPSRVMGDKAEMDWDGYILRTKAMRPEVEAAMAETGGASADGAFSSRSPISAATAGGGDGIHIAIDYSPHYDVSGVSNVDEFRAMLLDHDDDLKDLITNTIADAMEDSRRSEYV